MNLLVGSWVWLAACKDQPSFSADFVEPEVELVAGGPARRVTLSLACERAGDYPKADANLVSTVVAVEPETFASHLTRTVGEPSGLGIVGCEYSPITYPVTVAAAPDTPSGTGLLRAYVELETDGPGENPTLDATVPFTVIGVDPTTPADPPERLVDGSFEGSVVGGGLPTASGVWQGDLTEVVGADGGIEPADGAAMVKFLATGATGSTNTVASQLWQVVDLAQDATVAAGGAQVEGAVSFARVDAGPGTDRRFDLRLLAFDGAIVDLPAKYTAAEQLAEVTSTLDSAADQWQDVGAALELPSETTFVLFEIYAFEDQVNDGEGQEFAGHYADRASLRVVGR